MQTPSAQFVQKLAEMLQPLEQSIKQLQAPPIKLIIHAGTPKTGTTSLQTYLDKKQRKLRGRGILYPHNLEGVQNPTAPKHQWFEKNLVSTHLKNFIENFINIVSQVKPGMHTVILSSEGIYNYWWDFSAESKHVLSELGRLFDIELWVWFRDPLAFIESYYKQCIRNPRIENNPCYGRDFSLAEMLDIDWFSRHLDYRGFVDDCQSIWGKKSVSVFRYDGDVVQEVSQKLGLATRHDNPSPRKNRSLNSASIDVLRAINRLNIKAKDKERLMPHVKEINGILAGYAGEPLIDEVSRKKVLAIVRDVEY